MTRFGEILAEATAGQRSDAGDAGKGSSSSRPGTISNYENSAHFPDIEKLTALADFFDVPLDYLLGGAPPACRRVRWTSRLCRACRASRRGG